MLRRPIQVVLSGFRRVQCVNTTVDKVRHCNDNCINLNNMTHTQARHTRALWSNMQHDVHISRNRANYNNLIKVHSNKWDLPTTISTNIRGALASKIDEIKVIKDNYGVDVLAGTETWCTSRIPDGSLSLSGFNLYRRDRQDGRQHRGVVCYVRDTIPTKQWTELNQPELETMWMTIRPPKMPRNHPQITICTVYHPPGADDWTLLNHNDQSVDYVRRHHPYTGVITMGDLNKLRDSHLKRNHNLKQIVDIPTRGTATLKKYIQT